MLYPIATETRRILSLDGIWRFCFDPVQGRTAEGIEKDFPQQGLPETIAMPVPSAWNDLFEEQKDRDFVGWVWYEREFYIAQQIPTETTMLRFGSATHLGYPRSCRL